MEESPELDLGSLGAMDFTPAWAKKGAGVSVGRVRPVREGRDDAPRGERKSFAGGRPGGAEASRGERKPFKPRFDRPRRFEERPQPLDAEVKVLPDSKALGTIIRKLQGDFHAYKLKDLAYFFLDNPSSVLLKVTPKGEERFCQCAACGFASTDEEDVIQHVLNVHLTDYYVAKEVACEPPKGNFNCVAKCGLSGVLLGPPNIHEFNAVVREMIRTRYPSMSEAQYRSHIEMVRDAAVIDEWRRGAVKKTVFVAKGAGEDAPELSREQAEGEFRRQVLPSLLTRPKNLMITAAVALESPLKPLVRAVRDALEAERRAPYAMCFALRGALHHRKFRFFRVNDAHGQEFVTGAELKEFDTAHAIPELATLAKFIADNPCSSRAEIVTTPEAEKHLSWLVSTGHVVAFTNGVYSAVEKYPKYGPQWRKRGDSAAQVKVEGEGKGEGKAAAEEQPNVEESVKAEEVKDESTPVVAE